MMYRSEMLRNPYAPQQDLFNDLFISGQFQLWTIFLMFICPALSMRLFSADYREGSFELLLASPINSLQIVVGKYLGVLGLLCVLLAGTLPQIMFLYWMGTPDPGLVATGVAGCFLVGAAYLAVGMVASAFTEEQVLAFVITFGVLISMMVIVLWDPEITGETATVLQTGEQLKLMLKTGLSAASVQGHTERLLNGLVHLKDLVFFASFIGLAVGIATWRVESKRWN